MKKARETEKKYGKKVPWLPGVTDGHVNPKEDPLGEVRAFATGSCEISALVGPFHWKCSLGVISMTYASYE